MSVKLGDYYVKLSTTVALNSIRKSEELEKGWRKNEIGLPAELRDLDPVHVVPLKRVDKSKTSKEIMKLNLYSTQKRQI